MRVELKTLHMSCFRGATKPVEIVFDEKKPLTVIFGENGTGKSTIADALDLICNNKYGSLLDRSMAGQPKAHVASLGKNASDLKVSLTTTKAIFACTLEKSGPVTTPAHDCPKALILRRSKILNLIDAQPKDRYEALKTFIAVPGIERSESNLRQALNNTGLKYDDSVKAYIQAETELNKFWEAEGKDGANALRWAELEVGKDTRQLEVDAQALKNILASIQNATNYETQLKQLREELKRAEINLGLAEEELIQIQCNQNIKEVDLLQLLTQAKRYIEGIGDLEECPVCLKSSIRTDLLSSLHMRISAMNTLAKTVAKREICKKNLKEKEQAVKQREADFFSQVRELSASVKNLTLPEFTNLNIQWTEYQSLLDSQAISPEVLTSAYKIFTLLSCEKDVIDRRYIDDQKSINQKNAIKGQLDTYNEKLKSAEFLKKLKEVMATTLEIIAFERKRYVESLLGDISNDVERLYSLIHPNESIGKIRFYLKPNTIGSLEFDGNFQTARDIPPQAYYSESHLDTLGICVFLALAKHFATQDSFIVLDDIMTSVDSAHLDRFIKMLHEEAPTLNHVIVTTHYRPWRDRYKWARGSTSNTQIIELGLWSLEGGLRLGDFFTAIDELKQSLSNHSFDRQVIASKSGIILESLLDFLTIKYQCRLPRKKIPEYTLGALANAIDSKLGKALLSNIDGTETQILPLIEQVTSKAWVRNCVGCHFNALGSEISDAEIVEFAKVTLQFADAIICGKCNTLPMRRPTGSYWQCDCSKLTLQPLVYPGIDPNTIQYEE